MEQGDTMELQRAAERELAQSQAQHALGVDGPGHLFRLFVGWVPKLFTECDLKPLFDQWGDVRDIIVLKDKVSSQPRGCAFVSYATREEAEAAIQHLDRRVQLPGAPNKLEVRFARSHQYVQAGSGPEDNRQLFFARCPAAVSEADVVSLFSRFGSVDDVNLFKERRTGQGKGCGFVTMRTRAQALAAMEALDEKHHMDGCPDPIAVKWADPELQVKKRRAVEESNTENRMLFVAKILRSATEDEVRALFCRYGRVFEVNLFRAFQGAPNTKGCGLVTMGSNEEAVAAIEALDGRHTWRGMDSPMVVKWMDVALQRRRREEHLAAMRQGAGQQQQQPGGLAPLSQQHSGMTSLSDSWLLMSSSSLQSGSITGLGGSAGSGAAALRGRGASYGGSKPVLSGSGAHAALASGPSAAYGSGHNAAYGGDGQPFGSGPNAFGSGPLALGSGSHAASGALLDSGPHAFLGSEAPPLGCERDAYKLFVGNVPKSYGEEALRPLFESVGRVVELVVVREKATGESKGSAFVWYRTRADADRAVLRLNIRHVLPDPGGEPERPLVVRRANARRPAYPQGAVPAPGQPQLSVYPPPPQQQQQQQQLQQLVAAGSGGLVGLEPVMTFAGGAGADPGVQAMVAPPSELLQLQPVLLQQPQPVLLQQPQLQQPQLHLQHTQLQQHQLQPPQQQQQQPHIVYHPMVAAPDGVQQHHQQQQRGQVILGVQGASDPGGFSSGGHIVLQPLNGFAAQGALASGGGAFAPVCAPLAPLAPASAPFVPGGGVLSGGGLPLSGAGAAVDAQAPQQQQLQLQAEPLYMLQVQLSADQMTAITGHIYSVQTMSGAEVSGSAVGPGVFCLQLRGGRLQVENAHQLVLSVLQGAAQ